MLGLVHECVRTYVSIRECCTSAEREALLKQSPGHSGTVGTSLPQSKELTDEIGLEPKRPSPDENKRKAEKDVTERPGRKPVVAEGVGVSETWFMVKFRSFV